jgi:glutaconyl-CoA/methylmalonyl-CoA decarboxylase subunit gamma
MKKLRVTVEGKTYEVLVEMLDPAGLPVAANTPVVPASISAATSAPINAPVASAAPAPASKGPASAGDIPSPLAGKVVSIDVKTGQSVDEGAQVATVEAMKMNTYIYAPKAGVVSAILVNPGDGVEEGTALLRIG